MKYLRAYRRFIGTLMVALMLSWQIGQPLHAATIYWDSDTNAGNNSTLSGTGLGSAGNWNNSLSATPLLNWFNGTGETSWVNANNDTAAFWGTAGTVTLTDNVTVGGLAFNTTGYIINGNTNTKTLTFGATNNVITLNNVAAATITSGVSSVAGGNVTLSGGVYGGLTAGTLTFNGTQGGSGWSGTTTIGNGMTMAIAINNLALSATSGITLNGGGITLTNTSAAEAALNRIADGAGITSNGGTITVTNTASTTTVYAETLGTIALTSGQLNIVSTNANTTPAQTLTLGAGSLTHAASNTSAITFSGASLGLNAKNSIIVTSQATTAVGTIIGPWATWGTTALLQTDYASYNITAGATNTFGIQNAAIAASADSTWTNVANAYTANTASLTLGATAHNMLALRNTAATATITIPTGGNLNTYGLLNGATTVLTVAASGTGALSTPSGGGNLFVNTGAGAITISAPINDNGGAVTLVRTGSAGALVLSSTTSNFSGGLVIDAGSVVLGTAPTNAVSIASDANLGAVPASPTTNITFNSSGALLFTTTGTVLNANRTIQLNNGAIAKFSEGNIDISIAGKITGNGGVLIETSSGNHTIPLTNTGNDFQGPLIIGFTSNTVAAAVASLADSTSANGAIRLLSTTGSGVFQWSTAAISALTLNNRQIDITGGTAGGSGGIDSSNGTATNIITVNTDLLVTATAAKTLSLQGTNTGNNLFAGKIADGAAAVISLAKSGAGNWIISGANTYTGTTTVSAGTLIVAGSMSGSTSTPIINGGTLSLIGTGFSGAATVNNTGTLKISGAAGLNIAPITVNGGGTLTVDNTAASGGVVLNRLASQNLTLAGGAFNYNAGGSSAAATDTIGTLTISAGGTSTLNLTANTAGATTVTTPSLVRTAGGVLLVTGANLGATPGANNTNVIVTANGSGGDVIGGSGAAGSTTIGINPFVVGQDTALSGSAQYGFMTDKINGVMLGNGLRNLTAAEYASTITSGATTQDNVSLATAVTGINGATTINALRLGLGGSVAGSGTLTISSGAVLSVPGNGYTGIAVGTLAFDAQEAIFQTMASDLYVSSALTGSAGLSKSGSGVLTLNGSSSITGSIYLNSGLLRIGSSTALGSNGSNAVLMGNGVGTILDMNGFSASVGSLAGSISTGGVSLKGATLTVGTDNTSTTFAGLIYSAGALVKTGSGTLTLTTANTFAGATTINAGGGLKGGIAAFLPAATALTLNGSLDLAAFALTVGQFSGSGVVTDSGAAAALTLGNFAGSFDTTFSGVFNSTTAANLTVTKSGGGTLSLTAAAPGTATGAWTLNAGTIKLDFANSSATTNIMNAAIAPTLAGGSINVTGRSGATVAQTLGALTLNGRGGQVTLVDGGGGGSTALTFGALTLATTPNGGALLVTAPSNTTVKFATAADTTTPTGILGAGRVVFTDGLGNFNWATNTGTGTVTTGLGSYTNLVASGSTSTVNYLQTDSLTVTASESVNTLKITDTVAGGALALGSSVLTITTGGLLYTGANGYTISSTTGTIKSSVATNSDLIVHQYGTGTLTISAILADGTGASTLTKAGSGKLVLSGVNTYTGATFIDAGILSISNNNQLGGTATAAINLADGATLQTTATLSTGTHTYALGGGNATFDLASNSTMTVNGVISGVGGLTLTNSQNTGLATLQITAAATYTGPTFVGANTKLLGGATTSINASTGGNLTVASGGLVDMGNFTMTVGGIAGAGNIVNSGASAVALTVGGNNQSSVYSGVLQATGTAANMNFVKSGTGVLTLNAAALYTGTTTVNNGTLQWGVDNALTSTTVVTLGNAAGPTVSVLDLNGRAQTLAGPTLYGTSSTASSQAIINIGAGGNLTLTGTLTQTVNATAANGFLGAFINGGTLTMTAARGFAIADSINAAADLTITSVIAGAGGGITKSGAGNLVLAGLNNSTGVNTIQVGTLTAGINGALSTGGTWTVTATGAGVAGILDINGTVQTLNNVLTLGGSTATSTPVVNLNGGTLSVLGGITYSASNNPLTGQINGGFLDLGAATRTITVGNSTSQAVDLAISSVITGAGGLTIAGVGQLLLSGQSTYAGNTTMSAAGIVQAGVSNALPFGAGKGSLIINAGTFDLNGFNASLNSVSAAAPGGGIDNTSSTGVTLTLGTNDTTGGVYAGTLSNTGTGIVNLVKTGAGAQLLAGAVDLKGTITVNGGTLNLGSTLSNATALIVGSGGILGLQGGVTTPSLITNVAVAGGGTLVIAGTSLSNLTSLNLGAGSGTTTLGLSLGATAFSLTSLTAATTANTVAFNLTALSGLTAGTYTLLSAPGGLANATYKTSAVGGFAVTGLNVSNTAVSVTLGAAAPTTLYWNGGIDNTWNTLNGSFLSNWTDVTGTVNSHAMPGTATTAVFSANGQSGTSIATTLGTNVVINDLQFNSAVGSGPVSSISIAPGANAGNSLTIAPSSASTGITVMSGAPASISISAPVVLGAAQTWNVADAATVLNVSGIISGAAGNNLTKAGAGTLVLSSAVNFFGGAATTVNVQAGTLQFTADAQLGNALNNLSIGTSAGVATLAYLGSTATIARNIVLGTLTGSATGEIIKVGAGANLTLSGIVSGGPTAGTANTAMTLNGGGTLTLAGANTFTGNIIVDGSGTTLAFNTGALNNADAASTLGAAGMHSYTVQNGGTISLTGANTVNVTSGSGKGFYVGTGGGTFDVTASGGILQMDDAGQFGLAGNLTKTGAGVLWIGNDYSSAVTAGNTVSITAGTLRLGNINALGGTGSKAAIVMAGGTTLDLRINSGGVVGNNVTFNGDVTLSTGRGTAAATNINLTMGALTMGGNTVTMSNGSGNTAPGVANLAFTSTTLSGSPTFNLNNVNGVGIGTLSLGVLDDGGTARTMTLTTSTATPSALAIGGATPNTYSGTINVTNGTYLVLAGAGATGTGTVNVSSGSVVYAATNANSGGTVIIGDTSGSNSVSLSVGATGTIVNNPFVLQTGSSGTTTINTVSTGTAAVPNVGGFGMIPGGIGTISQSFDINKVSTLASSSFNFGAAFGTGLFLTGTIGESGGTRTFTATGPGTIYLLGNKTFTGGINVTGGTLVLGPASSNFTGSTTLNGGILSLLSGYTLPGAINIGAAALTLNANGTVATYGSGLLYNIGGATTDLSNVLTMVNGGTLTLDIVSSATTITYASVFGSGSTAGLSKVGAGTLNLQPTTGSESYTGATTVGAGVLALNFLSGGTTSNIISGSSILQMQGGTLTVNGNTGTAALTQAFASTLLQAGSSTVTLTKGTATSVGLTLGAITRSAGATVNFSLVPASTSINIAGTSNAGTTGILGGWATYNTSATLTDWAMNNGSNVVAPYASYTTLTATGGGTQASTNFTAGAAVTLTAAGGASITANSLRISAAVAVALGANNSLTINSVTGGIMYALNSGTAGAISGTAALATGLGMVSTGTASGGELNIFVNTGGQLTISAGVGGIAGSTNGFGITKSGGGTLLLTNATTSNLNNYTGPTVINGGVLQALTIDRLGNSSGITLNGGTLLSGSSTTSATFTQAITLGLNGGTLSYNSTNGNGSNNGGWSSTTPIAFLGSGSRTLTLAGTDTDRIATLTGALGDGGGPTSLVVNGGTTTSGFQLTAGNSYSGSTTIQGGYLILNNAAALPSLSNLIFNGTGTNLAEIELNVTSGTSFTRALGTGAGQVQWLGNGGFSAGAGTNTATGAVIVNLGGAGDLVTWGSGGFVPSGSTLSFNQSSFNNPSLGAIDFQNGIDFGGLTTRTIDVENGSYAFNTAGVASSNMGYDLKLSGNLISTITGGFTKTGGGLMWVNGNNSNFLGTMTIANGFTLFTNTLSLPVNANSLVVTTNGTTATGGVVLAGQTNFAKLYTLLSSASSGTLALDTSSTESINFSAAGFSNARFGAFGTVVYQGMFTPGTAGAYKFNGAQGNGVINSAGLSTLVLPRQNVISGASSTLDVGTGILLLGSSNAFGDATHGVNIQSVDALNSAAGGNSAVVMVAKDGALGSGPISLTNTQSITAAPAMVLGAAYGDHTLANSISLNNTNGITNIPFVLGGDTATDLVPSAGRMTYTGNVSVSGQANIVMGPRTTGFILNGTISGAPSIHLNGGAALVVFNNLNDSTAPSTFNGGNLYLSGALTFLIGHSRDLGDTATAGRILNWNSSAVFGILPGAGDITTSANITFGDNGNSFNKIIDVPFDQVLKVTSGFVSGSRTGQLYTKTGQGTLDIGAILNPGATGTWAAAGITINQGTLKADFSNAAAATNIIGLGGSSAAAPLTLAGGTLLLVGKGSTANSQAFGAMLVSQGASAITLNSAGGTLTTSFTSMGTRAAGGTVALTLPSDGPTSVAVTTGLVAQNSLLVDAAGTKSPFMVIGSQGGAVTDWAAVSGNTIVALSSYTPTTSSTISGNATVATGVDTTLSANAAADSLRFNLAEARTLNLGGNRLNVGGILVTSAAGSNASTISGGTLTTASGAGANADLVIYQADKDAALTISASITDNGANAVALTKSGAGELVLTGANSFSGNLFLNEGKVTFDAVNRLGTGAGVLNLNGVVLSYTGAADTLNAGTLTHGSVNVARQSTIDVANGAALTLSGTVTSTLLSPVFELLTKTGAGTMVLSGSSNNVLRVEVAEGTLVLNKSGGNVNAVGIYAINVLSNVGLMIDNGALVQLGGDTANGDQILNTSSVQLYGSGVLDLAGHSETIDGLGGEYGTLITNSNASGAVLTVGNSSMALGAPDQFDGFLQDGTGTLGLTMIGGNIFTLTNINTYTGKTTIIGQQYQTTGVYFGGISISSEANLGGNPANFTADQWTLNGGRLVMTGDVTLDAARSNVGITFGTGGGIFEVADTKTFTIGAANVIAGTGGLTKEGLGSIVMQGGANTYTGKTVLNQGVLSISAQGALGSNPAAATADQLTFNGGQLVTTATLSLNDANRGVTIQGYGGTLTPATGTTLTLANVISGTGDLTVNGAGTVVLGGVNTPWTGKTLLLGGELKISSNLNLGTPPATAVADQLQISNNAILHLTADMTFNANRGVTIGSGGATITTDAAKLATVNGVVTLNAGTLTKAGAGTLVLTGSNAATSGTQVAVTAGVLRVGSAGALSANSNVNLSGGGVIELAAGNFTRALGTGNNQVQFTGSGGFSAFGSPFTVNLGGAGATLMWNSGSFVPTGSALVLSSATSDNTVTFQNGIDTNGAVRTVQVDDGSAGTDAVLAGSLTDSGTGGGIVKTGAGTLAVTSAATYAGTTRISGGTLLAGADNVFASASAFTLDNTSGVSLNLNGHSQVIGSLAGGGAAGGNVVLGSGTLTAGGNNSTTVYAGVISGVSGGLVKTGTGSLSLTNAQTYTGATTVSGGGLFVNSTLASASVVVGSSGTLGGSGTVSALTTVNAGGTIQAGDVAGNGSLALTGGLSFASFGTLNVGQIAEAAPNILNIGALTSGSLIGSITINVISNSPSGYANGVPYTLLTYTGGAIQGAAGFSAFQLGTIAGTNSRTTGALNDTGSAITLTLNADNPKWTGFDATLGVSSSRWAALPSLTDWKLISAGTPTDYIEGDVVLFDDSAVGSTTVDISDGDVHPSSVTFNNSSLNYVLQGANGIAGTANFNKSGSGRVSILNANSFTGGVILNGGVIQIGNDNALGSTNGLLFGTNVGAGTKLQLNGHGITLTGLNTNATPGAAVVENGAAGVDSTLTLNLQMVGGPASGEADSVFAGVMQDGSTGRLFLTLTGDGSLTLTGANTYTGRTTISGGTLYIGNGNTSGSLAGTGGITNNAAIIFNRSDSYNYTGNITGTGTTRITGGGSLTMSGSLGSTGGVTIDNGNTLRIGNGGAGGSISGNILDNGALIFNSTNTALVVAGNITGTGTLQMNNASGITILTGTNTYGTGASTLITAGTLQIGNGGTTGSITGNVVDNGVLAFNRSDNSTFTGDISGSGSVLIKMSSPTAVKTLSGNNSYGGGATIAQGVLALGSATAVPSGSSIIIGGSGTSGTLDLNGFNLNVSALATAGTAANQTITNNSSTSNSVLTYNSAASSTFGGLISNGASRNISLVLNGGGTLTLADTNTFTGGVGVLNGTIRLGADGALGTGAITLGTTGTNGILDLNGFSQTVSSLAVGAGATAGSQIIGNSSTTADGFLTINGSSTFGGLIQDVLGAGTFKTGLTIASGTTILTNANTYSGATQINSGAVLQLGNGGTTGSLSNGTTILDNGTLSFNRSDLVVFGATVSGSGGVQQVGSGTLELTGANSYSGVTVMNNAVGTLKTSGTNSSFTGGTTLTAGTLLLNNTSANNGGLAGGTITISGGTIDNVTGSALTLALDNTLNLGGSFTFTGSNDLNFGAGAVNVSATAMTITIPSNNRTLTLGALTNTANNTNTITVSSGAGGTLVIGSYALSNNATNRIDVLTGNVPNIIINGAVTNGGTSTASGLNYTGTGILTLNGASNYGGTTTQTSAGGTIIFNGSNSGAGGVTLTNGTILLGGSANGGIGSGTVTLTAGTLQAINAARSLSNSVAFTSATVSGSQSLTFNGNFTAISAATRTLTNNITGTGNLLTFAGNVFLSDSVSAAGAFVIAGTGNTTVSGSIANASATGQAGTLGITNTGTTILSGTNTYSGTTTMNAAAGTLVFTGANSSAGATTLTTGTIQLNSSSNGGLASGLLTFTAGNIQALNATRSISNAIALTAVTVSGSQSLVFNGKLTGATGGSRTLTNNIVAGKTLTLTSIDINTDTAAARTLTITGTGATNITGAITNGNGSTANNLTLTSTGTTTLSAAAGSNTYTGTTTVGAGTLIIGATNTLPTATAFVLGTLATGGTAASLDVTGFDQAVGNFTVSSDSATASQLLTASGRTFTVNGNVIIGSTNASLTNTNFTTTGAGTFTVNNPAASGTFRVGGSSSSGNLTTADFSSLANFNVSLNTTNGLFEVASTSGTNVTNAYSVLTLAAANSITAATLAVGDGGQNNTGTTAVNTLKLGAASNTLRVNTINIGTGTRDFGAVVFNGSTGSVNIANADSSGGAAFNMGTGTANSGVVPIPTGNVFDVSGHNATLNFSSVAIGTQPRLQTYTNDFSFDKGTLVMDNLTASTRSSGAFGTTTTINLGSASSTLADTVTITNGILQLAQTTGTGAVGEAVTGRVNIAGGTVTIGATGGTAITMAAAVGSTTATAAVNLTGGSTTINGNIVRTGGAGTSSATVSVDGSASLDMTGHSIGSAAQNVSLVAAAGTLSNLGELNGGGALTKTTTGTLVLAGNNTYTGKTVGAAGKLSISSESNLGTSPGVATPDQLTLNGGTLQTTATLAIDDSNRGITVGAAGGSIETAASTTATISNVITGGGSLTKEGAGTLIFTAVNTNTGAVAVNNGILGGTGAVGGDLNVSLGGTVAPGIAAEGRLTVGGNLTLSAGGTLVMQLGGATTNDASTVMAQMNSSGSLSGLAGSVPAAWTNYQAGTTLHDNLLVNGALVPTINGTIKIDSAFLNGYVPVYGDIFKLVDWAATGSIVGTTNFDYSGLSLNGLAFNSDLFASNGILVVVPEPSRVLFLMLGLFGLMLRRRRSAC